MEEKNKKEENIDNNLISLKNTVEEKKEDFIEIKKKEKFDILDALKLVSPGTPLRRGIDDIVLGRRGALIVIASSNVEEIISGGFKLNCKFTPQRLFELSKMDGAIILSKDLKKIIYANCLLIPDPKILTEETGSRHQAAERTAKQLKTLVIAISERKSSITLYYNNLKYSLRDTRDILNKSLEKLQILEKQKEIYNNLLLNLNKLEITSLVSINDVSSLLQRIEIILRISNMMKKDIVELGNEGILLKIRMKELIKEVDKIKKLIIQDYCQEKNKKYNKEISKLNFDNLLETSRIIEIYFPNTKEEYIKPKGYRLLDKLDFPKEDIKMIIEHFDNLDSIINSNPKELEKILKNPEKVNNFLKELSELKENIMLEKIF
ncbi:MAG: DNA integrity scanning diadenylate cyclase DisA [Candidatus Pacearchaeota archaeon]